MTGRVLTIAALTVREATRRRLLAALAVITVAMVALSAWGFDRLERSHRITSGEANLAVPQALILFMFMFSFVVALSASAIASPSVSSEVESGVLMTVVTRPIRRAEIILGKWLGLAALLAGYAAAVCGLEIGVVDAVTGYLPPGPVVTAVYVFGEGLLLLTLALLLSTRMSTLASGVVGIAAFGAAWLGGVVGSLGTALNIGALSTIGQVSRVVLPTDGLWHGAIYYLEPAAILHSRLTGTGDPFFALSSPTWGYLLWVVVWLAAVLGACVFSFQRREL
ncbi:MAG TPA: ABC transporter permease subunit [Acidimicrobiales bacterium]|nr:ABC transporter permease subunit [Acidimicrobiales bacterium]